MRIRRRAWWVAIGALITVPSLLLIGLVAWLPSDEELARRVEQAVAQRFGVDLKVGALHWHLLPEASVVVENIATVQQQPLQLQRLTLLPRLSALLRGRVELRLLRLDGGVVAQRGLAEWRGKGHSSAPAPNADGSAGNPAPAVEVERVEVYDLTWISRTGVAAVYEGDADFDPAWQLRRAVLRRPGVSPVADLSVTRETLAVPEQPSGPQRFALKARAGGGSADGQALLQRRPDGTLQLKGQLAPRNVEVLSGLASFNRRSPVSGRAHGQTRLEAQGANAWGLVQTLHTETDFTMRPATLVRFDLDRVIHTLGREHQGETPLDDLTGRVDTQNTPDGVVVRFIGLKAHSGRLTASGDATLLNRQLEASAAVDLVDGLVGVPLRVEGPIGALKVSVSRAPVAGAVVGTAVLPGVGTVIGAAIGRLLGQDKPDGKPPAKAAAKPTDKAPAASGGPEGRAVSRDTW